MTIWILAFLTLALAALAGWRQGAIRAAITFAGIFVAALLAVPLGKMFHPLLPHLGASNPLLAWALAPVAGFIFVSIIFAVAAFNVHRKVDLFYKYKAGDLRLALWERLNARLGICLGLLNGAVYFVLLCFVIFNLSYFTTQASAAAEKQSGLIRLMNQLGRDLQSTGLAKSASAVGTLPPMYYQLADLSGFLMQNPQTGGRLAEYPALTSLWERDDMQPLVTDSTLTNALASGATLGEVLKTPSVQDFLKNKGLTKLVWGIFETNYDDLTGYLETGKSAKYDGEKILGAWELNVGVTIAWLRQEHPKMPASEMRSVRAMMTQAYSQTRLLLTADNQIFIKNLPHFKTQPGQPPVTELENWKGDWSLDGTSYTLHVKFNDQEKFMTATTEGIRMSVRDGKNLLIFERAD
jgi:uncharacterized membrane protein required for colicin V production